MPDKIKIGDLVETCSLMPGVVMKIDGDDIEVRMLEQDNYPDEKFAHCSISHCGVIKLTAAQALYRLALGKEKLKQFWQTEETYDSYVATIEQKGFQLLNQS